MGLGKTAKPEMHKYSVYDTVSGSILYFDAMPSHETGYSVSKSVSWQSTGIIGRSSPLQGYAQSGPKKVSIDILLVASTSQDDTTTASDVRDAANWLMGLAYPDYSGGTVKPPHVCILRLGNQLTLRCVLDNITLRHLGPWEQGTGLSFRTIASCSFIEVDLIPKDVHQVRGA